MFDSSVRPDQDNLPVQQHGGLEAVEIHLEYQLPSSGKTTTTTENDLALTLAPGPASDVRDQETDTPESKKKTLSTSSLSSTSSTSSSASMTMSSTSTSSLPTSSRLVETEVDSLASPAGPSQSDDDSLGPQVVVQQEDIKEVQIETEDPSHLFWVPFHMHPEIAPNEYNKWLSKHGVDSTNSSGILSSRKESINRRKSVLSAQYNPEDDDEDEDENEEEKEKEKEKPNGSKPETIAEHVEEQDFLSGTFYTPLVHMGEPPLKTKTSLRRSTSHTQSLPQSHDETGGDVAADMAAEDVVVVKRGSGLTRHGPSLLRRSARTKIRRNSTTSSEARNDTSRLRSAPIENDEYPAVTLVDPGPMPLPFSPLSLSMVSESTPASFDASENDSAAQKEVDHKPLKRFVSTLRDSSKPTITTYVEPQLLEQRRKELEGTSRLSESIPTSYITSTTTVTTATNLDTPSHPVNGGPASTEPSTQLTLESAVISKVTYPIPPPVKLSQNLLQQPKLPDPRSQVPPKHPSLSIQSAPPQKQMIVMQNQSSPANIPRPQPQSKKSSSWSWLWGKEKGGDKAMDMAQREPQKPFSALSSQPHLSNTPNEVVGKKQSTLSLLFSRNGKSSKAQSTSAESGAPSSFPGQMPIQGDRLNDPSRMPINIERAVYRLSHVKLANPRRPLHEQVLISNMMFWYLGVIQQQQQLLLQQQQQADLQQQQGQQQQQQQLQDQNQQQLPAEQSAEYVNPGTGEPAHLSPTSNDDETLEKKKSHQDGLSAVVETKVEGSEFVVPQQDSNSRARSPVEEVVLVQEIVYTQTLLHTHNHAIPSAPHEEEYDEESMIGGHFGGNSTWYDEEDYENYEDDMDAMTGGYKRSGAGSLYLQSGNQVSDSYKIHAMQTSGAC